MSPTRFVFKNAELNAEESCSPAYFDFLMQNVFLGHPMFCRNRTISKDYFVCKESEFHSRLHFPATQCDESEPRAGWAVCYHDGPRRRRSFGRS